MLAAMHGKISCVQKLIEAGANVCQFLSFYIPQKTNACICFQDHCFEVNNGDDTVNNLSDFDV